MKVNSVFCVIWTILIIKYDAAAIQPSTFGEAVNSFGKITNSIKVIS